jgi:hypothetical protein
MTTIEKIRDVLGLPKTTLYAESRLDDGRVIVTEAEAFDPGVEVKIIDDSGEAVPLDRGTYTLDNGDIIEINEDGRVANLGEEEIEVEVEMAEEEEEEVDVEVKEEDEEELNYEAVLAAFIDAYPDADTELLDGLAKIAAGIYEVAEVEELSSEEENINDVIEEAFNAISVRLSKLEDAPASEGISHTPKKNVAKRTRENNLNLNAIERALQIVNSHR